MQLFSFVPFAGGDAVNDYVKYYRRQDLPPLEYDAPLDLHPSRPSHPQFIANLKWENPWPFCNRAGVYLIYDENLDLMYIGKASMNRGLGNRLYEYFGGGFTCMPKVEWVKPARYVINIAVPLDMSFEAPALEEFLIRKLRPKYNGTGK